MKKKFNLFHIIKSSFRARMVAIIILITILPLSALGIISYTNYSDTISKITTQSVIQIAEQLNRNIESMIGDTEKLLEIANSNNVRTFLKFNHETYNEAKDILGLFKIYRNAYKFNPSIKGIYIIGTNGKCISENDGVYYLSKDKLNKSNAFYEIINSQDGLSILSSHIPSYTASEDRSSVISIGKPIRENVTHEIIGAIIIDLDISIIKDLCNSVKIGDTGFFFILDRNGEPVVYPGHDFNKIKKDYNWSRILRKDGGSNVERINGNATLIVNSVFSGTEWEIIGQVPLQEIMKDAYRLRNITFLILGICIMFTFIILIFISDSLTRPIRNLRRNMKFVEMGNLNVRVEPSGTDEIAELSVGFNKMIVEIKQLLEESIKEHENLKKSELKVLQSQINPHFLYNTLDAILWLAEAKENDKVVKLVNALSKFFRIALSKGKDFIKASDEIEHSRSYLTIQKIRYSDVLDYEIDIQEDVLDCMVLKLVLQPIVENAIYHGIKNKRGGGKVTLKARSEEDKIIFEILDDGIGIPAEKLVKLQAQLDKDSNVPVDKDRGYGLYNVDRRIRLYYGKEYGICLESEYGKGTCVTVCLPKRGEFDV